MCTRGSLGQKSALIQGQWATKYGYESTIGYGLLEVWLTQVPEDYIRHGNRVTSVRAWSTKVSMLTSNQPVLARAPLRYGVQMCYLELTDI